MNNNKSFSTNDSCQDFIDKRTVLDGLFERVRIIAPALVLILVVTISGMIFLPALLPLWLISYKKDKAGIKKSVDEATAFLDKIQFKKDYEYKSKSSYLAVDRGGEKIAYWWNICKFQPGIIRFDEIVDIEWRKEGDVLTTTTSNVAGGAVPFTTRQRGKTLITITTNRMSQPIFSFPVRSAEEAGDIVQRLAIALNFV